jgi:hypothetical protein
MKKYRVSLTRRIVLHISPFGNLVHRLDIVLVPGGMIVMPSSSMTFLDLGLSILFRPRLRGSETFRMRSRIHSISSIRVLKSSRFGLFLLAASGVVLVCRMASDGRHLWRPIALHFLRQRKRASFRRH